MKNSGAPAISTQSFATGCALVLATGVLMSTSGLIVRHIEVWDWHLVFYRSLAILLSVLIFLVLRDRSRVVGTFRKSGVPGLFAGIGMAFATIGFVMAVNATSVANTVFLLAASPFLAALMGWLLLRERVSGVTFAAMTTALVGVAIMVWHGLSSGSPLGTLMAVLAGFGFALFSVAFRWGRASDMFPSVCLGAAVSLVIAAAVLLISGAGFQISELDILLSSGFGVMTAVGLTVYALGARSVPAAILALLALIEVVLAPVWVWIVLGEVPHTVTLIGGAVVLSAIVGQSVFGIARRRVATAAQGA
ncbi:MAG: DMT family transporter [Pseudomonadota bacterium]